MSTATAPIHEPDDPSAALGHDMPSLIEAPKRRVSTQAIAVVLVSLAIVAVLIGVGVTRFFRDRLPDVRRAEGEKPTAATANAPGSSRLFGDAPPVRAETKKPPTVLALADTPTERFPAADGGPSEEAKPIPLKSDGSVERAPRRTASGRPPASDADGQVLVTQPGRGTAGFTRVSAPAAPSSSTVQAAEEEGASTTTSNPNLDATSRALAAYQQQLARTMENLTNRLPAGGVSPVGAGPTATTPTGLADPSAQNGALNGARAGLFGGALQSSQTARATAGFLGNRSLTLPKGTTFTCALKTKVISAASGFVACQVLRNVYSDDGRTVLIERGSQLDGEYRVTSVRPGVTRIPTIWTRARTPNGVVIDLESPATGALGEAGLGGYVDNRWGERIGAALLVGFLDDAMRLAIASADHGNGNNTVVLSSTGEQAERLPEKILDSTINLPPLIYQNQGGLVGIYLARDIDFSSVYELRSLP